jgi:L-aspartate oxidase
VLLTTGGSGQVFAATTNPVQSTGDGVAMALRAGVPCADIEFMQFHPTALLSERMPRPLLSEALRGHGALIRDRTGERFVDELLPRDRVARAITAKMIEEGTDHVWLDATGLESFDERFPTIAADLAAAGLDPATDFLPIAPAAHYHCGGVVTDLDGATALPGLWAAGEVACTGVHGANRLASNSLLEGMVFGPRVIEAIERGVDGPSPTGAMRSVVAGAAGHSVIGGRRLAIAPLPNAAPATGDADRLRDRLQRVMTRGAGVLRSAESLAATTAALGPIVAAVDLLAPSAAREEMRNLTTVATAIVGVATVREESRGCHTRSDHPDADPAWRIRLVI